MKTIIYSIILLLSFSGFSQELFLYDFDQNLSMNVPEDSGEYEMSGQTFIKGSIGDGTFVISKTNKGHEKLSLDGKSDLSRFFQGIKDGIIKASKGKILKDATTEIDNEKVLNFSYSMEIDGQQKIVDSYIFIWKKFTYTIQFVSSEIESENFKATKKQILDSIDLK